MGTIAQVVWQWTAADGIPSDGCENVWHFNAPGGVASVAEDIETALFNFWNETRSDTNRLADYLSSLMSGEYTIKVYDLADPTPRQPVYTNDGDVASGTSTTAPPELAVCLSYRGAYTSGSANARRRGRIYLGPLVPSVFNQSVSGDGRVQSFFMQDVLEAANQLQDDAAAAGFAWGVYSVANASFVAAIEAWVDNAPDIQRRRGQAATVRQTVDLS